LNHTKSSYKLNLGVIALTSSRFHKITQTFPLVLKKHSLPLKLTPL